LRRVNLAPFCIYHNSSKRDVIDLLYEVRFLNGKNDSMGEMKVPDDAYYGGPATRPVPRHALAIRRAALC
jgi:hypothetical protein